MVFEVESRPGISATELAEAFGVSVRTVYRDISALQVAGVPLFGVVGRGGGFRLIDGYRTDAGALLPDEVAALLAGVVPGVAAQLGVGEHSERAVRKMQHRPRARPDTPGLGGQVLVDPIGWYRSPSDAPHLAVLVESVRTRSIVSMRYSRWIEPDRPVRRRIAPLGLVLKAGTWYVMARSRGRIRTYRVDQIVSARRTDDHFEPDDGFDLEANWTAFVISFGERMQVIDVEVRVDRPTRDRIRREGDRALVEAMVRDVGDDVDDGVRTVTLPFESVERAVSELLRLRDGVEVLRPTEVRQGVAAVARVIADRYAEA
jgi:predicted DNA-binding transcriptional regulator YafY